MYTARFTALTESVQRELGSEVAGSCTTPLETPLQVPRFAFIQRPHSLSIPLEHRQTDYVWILNFADSFIARLVTVLEGLYKLQICNLLDELLSGCSAD